MKSNNPWIIISALIICLCAIFYLNHLDAELCEAVAAGEQEPTNYTEGICHE